MIGTIITVIRFITDGILFLVFVVMALGAVGEIRKKRGAGNILSPTKDEINTIVFSTIAALVQVANLMDIVG